ncbi:hypothetical protein PUR34_38640 [Streptomyces sp. JV185]|uniref:hypothetical protein n=1 Tax=Streptomyces sp. JV185 TaxID=858638 RepID=UPI002E798EA2|nr:hypothetical protein [Streptomyces sp. JV185]MEE1773935.1 hypothetical protein [Streptomyces sp. JV185]
MPWLAEAGGPRPDAVVLAAAGSTDPAAAGAHPDVACPVLKRFDEAAGEMARVPAEAATRTV